MVVAAFEATFWIILLAQPINSIAFTFDGIFKGLGEAVYLRNTLVAGTFLVFMPLLLTLDLAGFGTLAIWIAMLGWMIFRGATLFYKFRKILHKTQESS